MDQVGELELLPFPALKIVLDYVSHTDILKLRCASRKMQDKVSDYTMEMSKRLKEKKIVFETEETFTKFIASVDFSKFSRFIFGFDIHRPKYLQKLTTFLEKNGTWIQSLELLSVSIFMDHQERLLYEKVPNLIKLSVGEIRLWNSGRSLFLPTSIAYNNSLKGEATILGSNLPHCFAKLQVLDFDAVQEESLLIIFLRSCPSLITLKKGDINESYNLLNKYDNYDRQNSDFKVITEYLNYRTEGNANSNLKYLKADLGSAFGPTGDNALHAFVRVVISNGTKLFGVGTDFLEIIQSCQVISPEEKQSFFNALVQLAEFTPNLSPETFASLECLRCDFDAECFEQEFPYPDGSLWPALTNIAVFVYKYNTIQESAIVKSFWEFVFGCQRLTVKDINISSDVEALNANTILSVRNISLYFPEMESLCLDLKFLQPDEILALFEGLAANNSRLTNLQLTIHCKSTSRMFVGDDPNNPVFLRLTALKHLKLIEIETGETSLPGIREDNDFVEKILSRAKLFCLKLVHARSDSIYKKTLCRLQAVKTGIISKTLRVLSWKSAEGEQDFEYTDLETSLNKIVKDNKNGIISVPSTSARCRTCEVYEKMARKNKWFGYLRNFGNVM